MDAVSRFGRRVRKINRTVLRFLQSLGSVVRMAGDASFTAFVPPIRYKLMVEQMSSIGVGSIFIVVLTAVFTGMVFALQSGRAFAVFRAETLTGAVATFTLARELAPALTALMVTARSGSAMAAQIGTMKVTQQIDALVSMAVNPIKYLVGPRIVAALIMMPILTAIFNVVGILGAFLVGTAILHIEPVVFMEKIRIYVDVPDFVQGIFKSMFFGVIMAAISCYMGYQASRGAADVGRKVTQAVVVSSVTILVADYFLTALLF